jgi:mRNA interferase RelE/StbE
VSAYRLLYTARAAKDIAALDLVVRKRLGKKLVLFSESPLKYAVPLAGIELGGYRFRVGDHRVIFDLKGRDIIVLLVGHRREIYR